MRRREAEEVQEDGALAGILAEALRSRPKLLFASGLGLFSFLGVHAGVQIGAPRVPEAGPPGYVRPLPPLAWWHIMGATIASGIGMDLPVVARGPRRHNSNPLDDLGVDQRLEVGA